jgi:hypothetical protein
MSSELHLEVQFLLPRKQSIGHIIYYLYQQMHIYIYIKVLNYITNAPTCFSSSAPSSGSFDIAFAEVIKY